VGRWLAKVLRKCFGPSPKQEVGYELEEEDLEALGTVVEVIVAVEEGHAHGRIAFRGSTWPATSITEPIPQGERARLVHRDNLVWWVEPYLGVARCGEKDG